LSDRDGHWHPHLMFFAPLTEPEAWGAALPGSRIIAFPVIAPKDTQERLTGFLIRVVKWSDGTAAPVDEH
jgi:hypothetical protein